MDVARLKTQTTISREDIAKLLDSIGPPGKKQAAKLKTVQSLERENRQGYGIEHTLGTYKEY